MQKVLEADREDLLTYVIKFLIHEYIQLSLYTKNSQFSWLMKAKRNCCTIDKKNEIHNFFVLLFSATEFKLSLSSFHCTYSHGLHLSFPFFKLTSLGGIKNKVPVPSWLYLLKLVKLAAKIS